MLVSFEHRLIYVKGRKVASTSIEMALAPHCGRADIVTPITPADEFTRLSLGGKCQNYNSDAKLEARYLDLVEKKRFAEALKTRVHSPDVSQFYNHMPLSDIEAKLDIPFDQYSLVISERNPYDKIISFANMKLSFANYGGEATESPVDDIRQKLGEMFDTGEFRQVRNLSLYLHRRRYRESIVLRQERLESDLTKLFLRLGIGDVPKRWPHAKKGMADEHLDPLVMFTRDQLDVVNDEFSDEFRIFGYEKI